MRVLAKSWCAQQLQAVQRQSIFYPVLTARPLRGDSQKHNEEGVGKWSSQWSFLTGQSFQQAQLPQAFLVNLWWHANPNIWKQEWKRSDNRPATFLTLQDQSKHSLEALPREEGGHQASGMSIRRFSIWTGTGSSLFCLLIFRCVLYYMWMFYLHVCTYTICTQCPWRPKWALNPRELFWMVCKAL